MSNGNQDYKWTEKLPLLLSGLVAIVAGLFALGSKGRYAKIVGLSLLLCGAMLIYNSTRIKAWCAPADAAYGKIVWGAGNFHEPSFFDCLKLVK